MLGLFFNVQKFWDKNEKFYKFRICLFKTFDILTMHFDIFWHWEKNMHKRNQHTKNYRFKINVF